MNTTMYLCSSALYWMKERTNWWPRPSRHCNKRSMLLHTIELSHLVPCLQQFFASRNKVDKTPMSACYGWHVGKSGSYSATVPELVAAMYVVVLHFN